MATHPGGNKERSPLAWVVYVFYRMAGESFHLLIFLLLWSMGNMEYLVASWGRWIFGPLVILIPLVIRIAKRRDGPVMLYANTGMVLYNCPIWIGGLLYIGRFAPLWLPCAAMLLFALTIGRWVGRIRSAAWAFMLSALCGILVLAVYRTSEADWVRKCGREAFRAGDGVELLDERMHPYDVEVDPSGRYLYVAYGDVGMNGMIVRFDLESARKTEQNTIKGVQRIDFGVDDRTLITVPWGRQGREKNKRLRQGAFCHEGEGIYLLPLDLQIDDPDPCDRPVGDYFIPVRCVSNLFAAVQAPGDDLLCIAEMSKDVVRVETGGEEVGRIKLPGMNLYDLCLALDSERLVVSDQQWPWVQVMNVAGSGVVRLGEIYVGPFSFGLLTDPADSSVVYLAGSLRNEVDALDIESLQRLWTVEVGYGPRDLGVDADRRILLVGNYFSGTVSLIDLETQRELGRPFFGRLLRGVCYSPLDDRIYAATACGVRWASMEQVLAEHAGDSRVKGGESP